MKTLKTLTASVVLAGGAVAAPSYADDLSANVSLTNNYIWRGLTQSTNEPAVQGGIDWASDTGVYVGTWVSNVQYESDDVYSYEHDLYAGYAFEAGGISYDIGYLYYNYDDAAEFDFGEIYAGIGIGGFSLTGYLLANTEAEEGVGQDFGFGEAYYISADYAFDAGNGVEIGLHVGYHDGDFVDAFNGVDGGYADYNVSIAKDGFGFMITNTNADGDFATNSDGFNGGGARDNDEIKFVVSYSVDFDLMSN